jgi:hypothetical protein
LFEVDTVPRLEDEAGQIFRAASEGDIPRMKSKALRLLLDWFNLVLVVDPMRFLVADLCGAELAKRRESEGKSVEVVEEFQGYQNSRGLGALHVAAFAGKPTMCKFLIKKLRLDVNAAAQHGN